MINIVVVVVTIVIDLKLKWTVIDMIFIIYIVLLKLTMGERLIFLIKTCQRLITTPPQCRAQCKARSDKNNKLI